MVIELRQIKDGKSHNTEEYIHIKISCIDNIAFANLNKSAKVGAASATDMEKIPVSRGIYSSRKRGGPGTRRCSLTAFLIRSHKSLFLSFCAHSLVDNGTSLLDNGY